MMSVINNLSAMNAQRQYGVNSRSLSKTTEKLSSGYRINRAADDAAGLTISEKMRSLVRGLNQGSDNIQDGISLMQIADGALAEVHSMLQRANELAVKSANGTNTDADRAAIQMEIDSIVDEVDRIGQSTTFNTMHIFDQGEIEAHVGKLTDLVKSSSAESKKMTEAYAGKDGKFYPAATIDFSNINAKNVKDLNDGHFSFVCPYGCNETFKITFKTDGTPSSKVDSHSGNQLHSYTIDISSAKSGVDVVNAVYDYVSAHPAASNDVSSRLDGAGVSHSSAFIKDGNVLVVLADSPQTTPTAAANYAKNLPGIRGNVDCSGFNRRITPEPVLDFNIQCSNVTDDNLMIHTRMMNAKYIGIRPLDVSTEDSARDAIDKINAAIAYISKDRSDYGAYQNRLESSYNNNENKAENTQAAESQIRDADMAKEMVAYSLQNILAQAGTSMMAQANQNPQGILSLLQ